nr:hypothetical protein [Eubacterium sp.]
MSMELLTILQFSEVFCAYFFMTVILPAFVLRAKIRGRRLSEKFLMSFLAGNFYLMNLVFALQLLKISNQGTLILGTVVPAFFIWIRVNHIPFMATVHDFWRGIRRLSAGYLGFKTIVVRGLEGLGAAIKKGTKCLGRAFIRRPLEWLLLLVILGLLGYFYGWQLLKGYGYTASDTPVHMYWLNGMERNQIFIDGVYPFGYHCIIYYIHAVFKVDTYVMMRVFSFVQNIMIHMVLVAVIRLCCKSRYISYAAVGMYTIGGLLQANTYFRFLSVLPQEYGMLFILPSAYFAFKFFEERQKELKRDQKKKGESLVCLVYFAMSFSMTLAVHFYDTMIIGLYCVGIAVGYIFWFARKTYFGTVVVTCFISVMIAVLPMGIAFATGTPLQGSLGWGMSVINGSSDEETDEEDEEGMTQLEKDGAVVTYYDADGNLIKTTADTESLEEVPSVVPEPLLPKLARAWDKLCGGITNYVLNDPAPWGYLVVLGAIGMLFVLGVLFFLLRKRCYGAMLISTAAYMVLMVILQAAGDLGIPELMDKNRCRIYFAYSLPVVFAFAIDGVIRLVVWKRSWFRARNVISFACVVAVAIFLQDPQWRKEPLETTMLVTNEAITCLTNIIATEKDFSWTIVSANDETQMGLDHGYHYEVISLLREMELRNMEPDAKPVIQIPTESVYVFVEKVPLDYTIMYEGSGQHISEDGALRNLPSVGGIDMYMGENRWIVMSRLYYWAQEFQRQYPNEMKVYLETDDFICYKIEQNTYRLFNFAIDYGYNSRKGNG